MTGTGQVPRILIRGGRVYDHDGDIHQPAPADIMIGGERIERIGPNLPAEAGVEVIDAAGHHYLLETNPNAILRITSSGEPTFEQFYKFIPT